MLDAFSVRKDSQSRLHGILIILRCAANWRGMDGAALFPGRRWAWTSAMSPVLVAFTGYLSVSPLDGPMQE